MERLKNWTTLSADKDIAQKKLSHMPVAMQTGTNPLMTVWQFLTKLNIGLPSYPGIILLDVYPTYLEAYVHTKQAHKCF